jgi:hypothetical protein
MKARYFVRLASITIVVGCGVCLQDPTLRPYAIAGMVLVGVILILLPEYLR